MTIRDCLKKDFFILSHHEITGREKRREEKRREEKRREEKRREEKRTLTKNNKKGQDS
jgi:hypothetical protein